MAQNYGSLVARLLLQPVEESARLLFAKLNTVARESSGPRVAATVDEMQELLCLLLKLAALLGLVFLCFGVRIASFMPALSRWPLASAPYLGCLLLLVLAPAPPCPYSPRGRLALAWCECGTQQEKGEGGRGGNRELTSGVQ